MVEPGPGAREPAYTAVDPSTLIGKFRSKKDFYDYLSQHGKFLKSLI
jgi:hypothetical protein